jgi:hypothetical protein
MNLRSAVFRDYTYIHKDCIPIHLQYHNNKDSRDKADSRIPHETTLQHLLSTKEKHQKKN